MNDDRNYDGHGIKYGTTRKRIQRNDVKVEVFVRPNEWIATNKTQKDLWQERQEFWKRLSQVEQVERNSGEYWSAMESVWDKDDCIIEDNDFNSIIRSKAQGLCYSECCNHLENDFRSETSRSGSVHANNDNKVNTLDAFGNVHGEKAHLLPHARLCCKSYGFLAEAAVGMVCTDKHMRLKILYGVKHINNSSLREHQYNKMYLKSQELFYDGDTTSILIVPILSLKQVMDWSGGDSNQARESYDVMAITFGDFEGSTIAAEAVLKYSVSECTVKEIDTARKLLVTFLKGIAASLLKNDVFESFDEREIQSVSSLNVWKQRVEILRNPGNAQGRKIQIPVGKDFTQGWNPPRVAKGRMSMGNSLPDPWLLTMKAAINYSVFCKAKLMPCPYSDSDSIDDGPMNINYGDYELDDHHHCSATNLDPAAELFLSLQSGGESIEMYSDDNY